MRYALTDNPCRVLRHDQPAIFYFRVSAQLTPADGMRRIVSPAHGEADH